MQLVGQQKRLQSRSPSDSRSPTASRDDEGVKVIQDRVFQAFYQTGMLSELNLR